MRPADRLEAAQRRLQVEARKWVAGRLYPKAYGDRVQTDHSGSIDLQAMTDEQIAAKLLKLLERMRSGN